MEIPKEAVTIKLSFTDTFQDDNGVTRHLNKILLTILNEDLLPWKFNLENLNEESYCCSVVNRKVDLEKLKGGDGDAENDDKIVNLPFGIKFSLEQTDLLSSDSGQRRSTYTLYISQVPGGGTVSGENDGQMGEDETRKPERTLYGKALTNVGCACLKKEEDKDGSSFSPTKIFELEDINPFPICIYKHSAVSKCTPKTIDIQLELFDFSKAITTPFEVQELIAKRDCLTDTSGLLTTWLAPFDITIHCNDGYKIRAHKAILAARSPVFSRMFGGKDKKVKIEEDVQYAPMEVILQFVYSGSLHRYWKYQPEEVLEAASSYELIQLVQFFDTLLPQICTNENALKLLKLAEDHDLTNAHKQIYNYIKKNFRDVFTKTVSFDWK